MKKLFVLGDSISLQYGPFLKHFLEGHMSYAYKQGLAEALKNLDEVKGANGGNSAQVLAYLHGLRQHIDCDYLLLNCGLHDIRVYGKGGSCVIDTAQYADNLRALQALAKDMGTQLLWASSTPLVDAIHNAKGGEYMRFSKDLERYNAIATEVMEQGGVPIIDLYGFTLSLGGNEIYADHVHFTETVQRLQGAYLAGWLIAWDKQRRAIAS